MKVKCTHIPTAKGHLYMNETPLTQMIIQKL